MSAAAVDFADLTQSAFLLGVPARTWETMLGSAYGKLDATVANFTEIGESILGALLELFVSYPGDQTLLAYLHMLVAPPTYTAMAHSYVPLSNALGFFIRNAGQMTDPATFHLVFKTLIGLHYANPVSAYGSIITYGETVPSILNTVNACLPLLSTWESLTSSTPFHGQPSPISQIIVLLLSYVQDYSSITTTEAMMYYSEVQHALQTIPFDSDTRQALENLMMSLGLVVGDNAKAAREVEMMQAIQLNLAKSSSVGAAAGLDIITCGTLLRNLFDERAHDLSFGHTDEVVAVLRAVFHYTAMPLPAFYTQLILAAFDIVSQYAPQTPQKLRYQLWCSLVISRLPALLRRFDTHISAEIPSDIAPGSAVQAALRDVYSRTDLLGRMDSLAAAAESTHVPLRTRFLQSLVAVALIDHPFASSLEASIPPEQLPRLVTEAQEHGMDLESYIESRVSMDGPIEDGMGLLDRAVTDFAVHASLSEVLQKRFISLASTQDVEPLSHMCKVLSRHDVTVDILSLHVPLNDILGHGLHFVHNFTCEGVGDPQTAVSQFGVVVQFMQLTLTRLQLASFSYSLAGKSLRSDFLLSHRTYTMSELSREELVAFQNWHKALFGRDSDGIDDNILRSTNPLTLLRITPTLLSEAAAQAVVKVVDAECLRNGVQFFVGPLLNWTLVGVVKAFVAEIDRLGYCATMQIDVLKTLAASAKDMPVVFRLCANNLLRMVPEPQAQNLLAKQNEFREMKRVAAIALYARPGEPLALPAVTHDHASYPSLAIRRAIEIARSGGAPGINVRRCLTVSTPVAFLEIIWAEFTTPNADVAHEHDIFRRIAAHILVATALHCHPNCPPLLPVFLHSFLPRKIAWLDAQLQVGEPQLQTSDQRLQNIEMLTAILMSSMTAAFHLERSLNSLNTTYPSIKAASTRLKSMSLAARLSQSLRISTSPVTAMIRQRLSTSHSFVAMYPEFAT
ncbi:hypothetical protein EXIGLDRAFT_132482 [Exidia glandulosa HHB12029]|uniref:Mediator of RNA polymerase II transcription subunit 5 n=1 Tax=Exidia glandulosa HHB12029 TaxID=1314781 RepID=A0A165NE65_EXIGL|nr:hypothetical protein EXIGLDRAFT_132482 [Exidia glandulosa HHB12029]